MAKLSTKEIREIAKKILEGYPTGLRFTPLWKQISSEHPETNQNTIFTQVSMLAKDESATVAKPSRGLYQLVKYADAGSGKTELGDEVEIQGFYLERSDLAPTCSTSMNSYTV